MAALSIRQDQVDALEAEHAIRLARLLAARVRAERPSQVAELDDEALATALEMEIAAARGRGLRDRHAIERFCALALDHGFGFADRENWARAAFAEEAQPPIRRLAAAEAAAPEAGGTS